MTHVAENTPPKKRGRPPGTKNTPVLDEEPAYHLPLMIHEYKALSEPLLGSIHRQLGPTGRADYFLWSGFHAEWRRVRPENMLTAVGLMLEERFGLVKGLGHRRLSELVDFLKGDDRLDIPDAFFDTDDWLLRTKSWTLDLRTVRLRRPAKEDTLLRHLSIDPDPELPTPHWTSFLASSLPDAEVRHYVQKLVGYCLTGITSVPSLHILHGNGGNGKGVFMRVLEGLLGTFCRAASMKVFQATDDNSHSTDLHYLKDARCVLIQETGSGKGLHEVNLKKWSGGDTFTARAIGADPETFKPRGKLLISSNHPLRLTDPGSPAWRRRVRVIPFNVTPREPDYDLDEKLTAELPGILAWAIEGCLRFQTEGLALPPALAEASTAYLDDADVFREWLDQVSDHKGSATTKDLFRSFKDYCEETRNMAALTGMNETVFSRELARRTEKLPGVKADKNLPGGRGYHGFSLGRGLNLDHETGDQHPF